MEIVNHRTRILRNNFAFGLFAPGFRVDFFALFLENHKFYDRNGLLHELLPYFRVVLHHDAVVETPLDISFLEHCCHVFGFYADRNQFCAFKIEVIFLLVLNNALNFQASIIWSNHF